MTNAQTAGSHHTKHLFACASNPTNLEVGALWMDPIGMALLLRLDLNNK